MGSPGSTFYAHAPSTGLALARALELRPPTELTLVTNSPAIALGLTADSIHVIVPPGELNQHMRVLTGRWTYRLPYVWSRMSVSASLDRFRYASSRRWPGPRGARCDAVVVRGTPVTPGP